MQSIESIREAATAQGADKDTLWKLDMMVMIEKVLNYLIHCQTSMLEDRKDILKLQERIQALECDHDHLAEAFQDVADAVLPVETA